MKRTLFPLHVAWCSSEELKEKFTLVNFEEVPLAFGTEVPYEQVREDFCSSWNRKERVSGGN